jgi:membrane protease YdiL (CAAX protease family)
LMGAFLGWIFLVTENLLPVIITHGLYDFLALAYLTRVSSRR